MNLKIILKFINENGIVSSLIASVIFAFLIFAFSRDKSVLAYEIVTNQKLFESENNEALIILRKDSQQVKNDIYFLEIDIWNQGNKQIETKNIKDKISFYFEDKIEILEGVKIEETHPKVTKAKLHLDSLRECIFLSFDFLEKGNGIKLKGYYSNNIEQPSNLIHSGYITEGGKIQCFNKTFTREYSVVISIVFFLASIVFYWFASKYMWDKIDRFVNKFIDKEKYKVLNLIVNIILSILAFYFIYMKFLAKIPRWVKEFLEYYFNPDSPFNI